MIMQIGENHQYVATNWQCTNQHLEFVWHGYMGQMNLGIPNSSNPLVNSLNTKWCGSYQYSLPISTIDTLTTPP
jgi:hypothetical protein